MNALSLAERLLRIARALSTAGIPYAFGGAIALNYYAEPRATRALDVTIFLPETQSRPVLSALAAVGLPLDATEVAPLVERDGQVRLLWGAIPVDLFFATVPFLELCATRIRDVPFEDERIAILAAEDLAICKILFNREKDWLDLRQMLLMQGEAVDLDYVHGWLNELIGPDDERLRRFIALAERPLLN